MIIGAAVCAFLALLGIVYSLTSGAAWFCRCREPTPPTRPSTRRCNNIVEALAIGEGIPKPAVYVIEDPSPNAFATGTSPDKAAITSTTGLLAIMNREELEGVISHEMSHIKNYDVRLLLIVSTLIGMAGLLASLVWRRRFFAGGGREDDGGSQLMLVVFAAGLLLAVVGVDLRSAHPPGALTRARGAGRRQRRGADPQPGRA